MSHEAADRTEGRWVFGTDAEGYDRGRPAYPERVFEVLVERCGLAPGTPTFELGPGTGKASRRLLELGADPLVGIEPDPQLVAFLERTLGDRPELELVHSTFEEADVPTSAFALGCAASSFHWVEEEPALRRVAELLRPGGWWAAWWNGHGDHDPPDAFRRAAAPVLERLGRTPSSARGGRPRFAQDFEAREAALRRTGLFEDVSHDFTRWSIELDTAGVLALFSTYSQIRRLSDDERARTLDGLADVAEREFGGRVQRPFTTALYTARRVAS